MSSTAFDSFDRRRAPWPRLVAWLEGGRGAQDAIKRSTTFPAKVAPSGVVGARFAAGAGGAGSDDQGRRRIPFPGRGRRPQGVRAGPPEARVLERLMADPDGTSVEGATRDVTVLFADVRGFTGLAESMRDDPQRLAAVMRVILAPLTRIVLAHGGTIDLESVPGRGTTVRVHLPLAGAAAVEPTTTRDAGTDAAGTDAEGTDAAGTGTTGVGA